MKKKLCLVFLGLFVVGILCLSVLIAGNENSNKFMNTEDSENQNLISEYNSEEIQITKGEKNKTKIREGNFSVDCECNLTEEKEQNKTKLKMKLSNGKNSEIKIMPETASTTAIQRLMIKNCNPEN